MELLTENHTKSKLTGIIETDSSSPEKKRVGSKSYKIQIQLSQRAKDRLFELVERTESESAAQVVREALRVYDILINETEENGNELMLKSPDTSELVRLRLF